VDLNQLIARAKGILLTPKTEWPIIATEPAATADLYKNYIVILALIPAVFTFLKMSLIGVSVPFAGTVRIGIGAGLTSMAIGYVLSLAMVWVMAVIVDALAPTFGAQRDRTQALKTVAYAYTASWVAGVGQILPFLAVLISIAGGIYSIYLLYLGLPHTMKCPPDKAAGYTAVSIIIAIVLSIILGMIVGSVTGLGSMMSGAGSTFTVGQNSDAVQFDKDSPMGKLEHWSKSVEQAGKQMEAAQKSGDSNAQAEAMKAMMGAALGGGQVEALPPDRLKSFIPESLGGMPRTDMSVERNNAMGMQISEARATYANEAGRSVRLEITDTGTAKGLLALAGWAGMEGEKQSDRGYEKTYRSDGRLVHEEWSGSSGEFAVVLGDRFTVALKGEAGSIDELKAALGSVDLGGLEALKNEGVKTR
jgi:hypothetical protein